MMHSPEMTADFDTLLRQSSMTSDTCIPLAEHLVDVLNGARYRDGG